MRCDSRMPASRWLSSAAEALRTEPPFRTEWASSSSGAGGRVSAVACGPPLSLSHLPSDRIVRLAGLTDEQLAVALDPPPPGVPVVIRYRVPNIRCASNDVVDDVLDQLQAVALDAFPAWLRAADATHSASDFDRRTVRQIAHRHAADSAHFGPFLADLA